MRKGVYSKPPTKVELKLNKVQGEYLFQLREKLREAGMKVTYREILNEMLDLTISGSSWYKEKK